MTVKNDKRSRLIEAASQLFYKKGVSTTTLANIAELAEVPLGNVYYYFKSKESIILAVIEQRREALKATLKDIELNNMTAKERLSGLIHSLAQDAETTASFGDFLGGLCQELGKQGGMVSDAAASLMQENLNWCGEQFRALGKDETTAKKLAMDLVSNIQGMNLLTLTFKDPGFTAKQSSFLIEALDK